MNPENSADSSDLQSVPSREALLAAIERRRSFLSARLSKLRAEIGEMEAELSAWGTGPSEGHVPDNGRSDPRLGYRSQLSSLLRDLLTERGETPYPEILEALRELRRTRGLARIREETVREILATGTYRETDRGFALAENTTSSPTHPHEQGV